MTADGGREDAPGAAGERVGKAAVAAIVGRPSSGKSTLLNRACGAKVSIVSPVPQTTRNRIRGIASRDAGQLVFIDTPGWHLSEQPLNKRLVDLVSRALADAELVLYVVDGTRAVGAEELSLLALIQKAAKPTVIALNKRDRRGAPWREVRRTITEALPQATVIETAALSGEGVESVVTRLLELAPQGDQLYPAEYYTDQDPEFRVAEIIREKAIAHTREELPHAIYVRLEDLEMRDEGAWMWVRGFILVERESQKGILVGKAGEVIRSIVEEAERELSEIFPYEVRLDLRVKVDRDWRHRESTLRRLIR